MTPGPIDGRALIARLRAERVVPVLRAKTAAALEEQLQACVAAGLGMVEITTTSPGWQDALERVIAEPRFDGILVGVGTVTTAQQADDAIARGAQFLVSPYPSPAARARAGDTVFIEGGLSPAEIATASASTGLAKLFPASSVGVAHLSALRDVLPEVAIMPTGGVTTATAPDWIAAGAVAVGMGGGLLSLPVADIRAFLARVRG